jgi:general nucleoside transport system permease protein
MSRRAKLPAWADIGLIPLINVLLAFLSAGVVVALIGESPLEAVQVLIRGAFGYDEGVGYTLYYTTNFIFTGLAVAVAFHAGGVVIRLLHSHLGGAPQHWQTGAYCALTL